eukprot:SAG31_NODE_2056_length_6546_cov_1.979060_11_plen_85_part_00
MSWPSQRPADRMGTLNGPLGQDHHPSKTDPGRELELPQMSKTGKRLVGRILKFTADRGIMYRQEFSGLASVNGSQHVKYFACST